MTTSHHTPTGRQWFPLLETVGAELFLRYRKRWLEPDIGLEIRRDYPGQPIVDILLRVAAARRLVRAGWEFEALEAIRSGRWERHLNEREHNRRRTDAGQDRVSRGLVTLGGVGFAGFCALPVLSGLASGGAAWLVVVVATGCAALAWRMTQRVVRARGAHAGDRGFSVAGGRGATP